MKEESIMPSYFQFPVFLMESPLSQTARITYMILYDRARLSQKNGWVDEEGRVYFIFPIREICKNIGRGESAIKQALNDLEMAGLLVRKRGGFANANRLYLQIPFSVSDGKASSISTDKQLSNSRKKELTIDGLTTPNKVIETSNKKQSYRTSAGSSLTNNFGKKMQSVMPDYSCLEGENL